MTKTKQVPAEAREAAQACIKWGRPEIDTVDLWVQRVAEEIARAYQQKEVQLETAAMMLDAMKVSRTKAEAALKLADELAEYLVESEGCNDACDDNCEHKQARCFQEARKRG